MTDQSNSQALQTGESILWYRIDAVLGQGGFGITYRAHDTNLDLPVALKEYLPSMFAARGPDGVIAPTGSEQKADYEWGLARFIDEGRTLARFDHPGIVRVHSVFEANGTAYLVMRYEDGDPLDSVLKRSGTLPEAQLRTILFDIMDGLVPVHEAGFIHRDIKPANIYLRRDGSAVLIDFGSARQALGVQTQTLTTLVSPGYAPFEQYSTASSQQGPWTDIYALGATAYRAMTGRSPMTAVDRSRALLTSAPDQTLEALTSVGNYSRTFVQAIEQAIAFHEQDRPQTVLQWRALFDGATNEHAATEVIDHANVPIGIDPGDAEPATERYDEAPTEVLATPEVITAPAAAAERASRATAMRIGGVLLLILAFAMWRPWHDREDLPAPGTDEEPTSEVASARAPKGAQSGATTAALAANASDEPDAAIARLLAAAGTHVANGRLTRPAGGNALDTYRQVLDLDPFNDEAEAGIERIVQNRLARAREATAAEDPYLARAYLDEAALADPAHRDVLLAESELARAGASPATEPESVPAVTSSTQRTRGPSPSLTESLLSQADKLADPRTRKQLRNARNAAQKQDYRKALKLLRKGFE